LYGVFGDPAPVRGRLVEWLSDTGVLWWETQQVAGHEVVRVKARRARAGGRGRRGKRGRTTSAAPATGRRETEAALRRIERRLKRIEKRLSQPTPGLVNQTRSAVKQGISRLRS